MTLPTVITTAGLQPQSPVSLQAQLLAAVAAINPGYTANLPGSLIEDISSTDVAATVLCDSARVETVNSLTPYGANAFLLNQLGQIYGIKLGLATNTSVGVIFSGLSGYVIPVGFTVSDGQFYYTVQDGGIIQISGQSASLFCLATVSGSWAIPVGTVTELTTSVPSGFTLTCSNQFPGIPGINAETEESYRSRVLQAGLAASQGMTSYLKTLVANVPGVQPRLISAQQQSPGGWKIIVGGGDIYAVAYAIFQAMLDISTIVGSVMAIQNITQANPGVITTVLNHGYPNGQIVIADSVLGMTPINGVPLTVTVISQNSFSIGINTTAMPPYTIGGELTPNFRNNNIHITDYPDVYQIIFVTPPQQLVTVVITWNTTAINFVNSAAIAQLGAPAVAEYINTVPVGQPMNLFQLEDYFQEAVTPVLPGALLTRMVFAVSINGVGVLPSAGTFIISGDPESYFYTDPQGANITVIQG